MGHAVLFTKGTRGDLAPFVALGDVLKRRGHDVVLISHYGFREIVQAAGLRFVALDTEEEWERYQRDIKLLNTLRGSQRFFEQHYKPRIGRECSLLMKHCEPGHTALIVRHAATFSDSLLAHSFRLRLVRIFTSPYQVVMLPLLTHLLSDAYFEAHHAVRKEVYLSEVEFKPERPSYVEINIGAWPHWFGDDISLGSKLHEVGFMISQQMDCAALPNEVEDFLLSSPSPLLITAGSANTVGADLVTLAQKACKELGARCILLRSKAQDLSVQLDENGNLLCPLLPFSPIIRRVGAVIHHGGMGTISHAASAGVPQLVLPEGADRPDNAARVQRHFLGRCVMQPDRSVTSVTHALHDVLRSRLIADKCAESSRGLEPLRSADTACHIIETVCGWSPVAPGN